MNTREEGMKKLEPGEEEGGGEREKREGSLLIIIQVSSPYIPSSRFKSCWLLCLSQDIDLLPLHS